MDSSLYRQAAEGAPPIFLIPGKARNEGRTARFRFRARRPKWNRRVRYLFGCRRGLVDQTLEHLLIQRLPLQEFVRHQIELGTMLLQYLL